MAEKADAISEQEARQDWLERLGSQDAEAREEAVATLCALGPEAIPILLAGLEETTWRTRASATKALGRLRDPGAILPLVAALDDPHEIVRWGAEQALERIGLAYAVPALIDAMNADNVYLRGKAAWLLAQSDDVRAVPSFLTFLVSIGSIPESKRDHKEVRLITLAFQRLVREDVRPLLDALRHESSDARWGAASVLGQMAKREAIPDLALLVAEKDTTLQYAGKQALCRIFGNAWDGFGVGREIVLSERLTVAEKTQAWWAMEAFARERPDPARDRFERNWKGRMPDMLTVCYHLIGSEPQCREQVEAVLACASLLRSSVSNAENPDELLRSATGVSGAEAGQAATLLRPISDTEAKSDNPPIATKTGWMTRWLRRG